MFVVRVFRTSRRVLTEISFSVRLQRVRFFLKGILGYFAVTGEGRESKVEKADDALSLSVQASNKYSEEQKKCKSKMERLVRIFCGGGDR